MKAELIKEREAIRNSLRNAISKTKVDESKNNPWTKPSIGFSGIDDTIKGARIFYDYPAEASSRDNFATHDILKEYMMENNMNKRNSFTRQEYQQIKKKELKASVVFEIWLRNGEKYGKYWQFCRQFMRMGGTDISGIVLLPRRSSQKDLGAIKKKAKCLVSDCKAELKRYLAEGPLMNGSLFTIWSYLEIAPGLLHFIFIDRSNSEAYAPNIMSLRGGYCDPLVSNFDDPFGDETRKNIETLRKRIWKCIELGQIFQQKGYTSYVARDGDIQYYYKFSVEDESGRELAFSHPYPAIFPQRLPLHDLPINCEKFANVTNFLFPLSKVASMYEIYALFVGYMPIDSICKCISNLTDELKQKLSLKKVKRR